MYWYCGQLIDSEEILLKIDDSGLLYGATVFTTLRVYDRSLEHPLTCWQAHCDRLNFSLTAFDWCQPCWQNLERGARLLLKHFPVLRIAIFADGRELITGRYLPQDLKQRQTLGITAWVAREPLYQRSLAQHKTGNYLPAHLARQRALSLNALEAILVDRDGNWLETSTGNLWGWQKSCWYTPCLDSAILPGIARSRWLDHFQSRAIEVVENVWSSQFVTQLECLFYSNCVVEMVPIATVIDLSSQRNYRVRKLI